MSFEDNDRVYALNSKECKSTTKKVDWFSDTKFKFCKTGGYLLLQLYLETQKKLEAEQKLEMEKRKELQRSQRDSKDGKQSPGSVHNKDIDIKHEPSKTSPASSNKTNPPLQRFEIFHIIHIIS